MATPIALFDTVATTADLPALDLTAGEVGAVVEVFGEGEAFEVEFCDGAGAAYALHTLKANQIVALHNRGKAFRVVGEAA